MNKTNEIKNAVEKIVGHKLDTFMLLGYANNDERNLSLRVGKGAIDELAIVIDELFEDNPQLEEAVNTAKQIRGRELTDKLLKQLFENCGGGSND